MRTGFLAIFLLVLTPPVLAVDLVTDEEMELIDEFAFLEDAGMVELSSRHRQEIGMSPSAITVLTREDIEASGATNLPDLLRIVPGMDVIVISPSHGSLTSRLQWGNTNSYFQLLVDGRDCIHDILGQVPWMVEDTSLEDIERIEILRGPASSMYGASALAGVVSITTRVVPEKTSASAWMEGGELGLLQAGARASTRLGNWGFSVSGGGGLAGSYSKLRKEGRRMWKLRALTEYTWSDSQRLRIDFGMRGGKGDFNSAVGMVDLAMQFRDLRVAYESKDLRGRLYWSNTPGEVTLMAPFEFQGIHLANFIPVSFDVHILDGEVQWTAPTFWDPLLMIVGGGGRFVTVSSDQLLDGETYADITSPDYHQAGMFYMEARAGAFVHAELKPSEWVTISGSLRFDYNTETDPFLSPRLVAVFQPAKGQYLRMGISRAFRKPAFINKTLHPLVEFPQGSPITGEGQQKFLEFMSRNIGNDDLDNEKLLTYEGGYLGQFLDRRLSVAFNVYFAQIRDLVEIFPEIVADEQGLPDLDRSEVKSLNEAGDLDIAGCELVVRYTPTRSLSFLASWVFREVFDRRAARLVESTPKNLVTLGGRFRTLSGLVGSLYLFSRSELTEINVENPEGLFAPLLTKHVDHVFLIMGKLGYRWPTSEGLEMEVGAKLFLPVSPFSGSFFRYYEDPGGMTYDGRLYGGEELRRMLVGYVKGSF
jgi:outer membrane receptor protein involved in Fe transport